MHVYFHVPFCARRCSYCDFAIAVRREVPSAAYVRAVLREWADWQRHPAWDESPEIATVYFGGGTPSRLDPGAISQILGRVRADRAVAPDAEVTLEANPEDVSDRAAAAWAGAGVNRVSLGAQSFAPHVLRWMHRTHAPDGIGRAVAALRAAGIRRISLDLIFGLPAELGRDWRADLEQALALAPEHLSLYGLTTEAHTPLARWTERGEVRPVDDERYAEEYLTAHGALAAAGLEHYEVSSAARPGHRARHNSAYWRRAPFIGIGPSAHSGLGTERRWNLRDWAAYARAVGSGEPWVAGSERLDAEAVRLEELYLGLRTVEGVPRPWIPEPLPAEWAAQGWALTDDRRVRLTPEGWLRLDALVAATPRPSVTV